MLGIFIRNKRIIKKVKKKMKCIDFATMGVKGTNLPAIHRIRCHNPGVPS